MLSSIAIVPSAPVLVPELSGGSAAEFAELRAAVRRAVEALPSRWQAIGVAATAGTVAAESVGTFAGYGRDVQVRLAPQHGPAAPVAELPLAALITGWIRGHTDPAAVATVRCLPADLPNADAEAAGRELRARLDAVAEAVGVLVVADGLRTLTPGAPGGYDPDSVAVQKLLDTALAGGDTAALAALPDSVVDRAAFAALAGLAGAGPHRVQQYYRGAPLGVGYFAGTWWP